jgi:pimeloyl-ACP methyl ester carboxylesterase
MRDSTLHLGDLSLHAVQAGQSHGPSLLFLHGWPQCSKAFEEVMEALADDFRVVAIDLPGVGRSVGSPSASDKQTLAGYIEAAIRSFSLTEVTLVGHDVGGQIAYAYLRRFPGTIERAAILNVALPAVEPWADVVRNPHIWHLAFNALPRLPELLVRRHTAAFFDYFFDAISADPSKLNRQKRRAYTDAYRSRDSLKAGFDWYRAFPQDEKDNIASAGAIVSTPVLYVRGAAESGQMPSYLDGLRKAGLANVTGKVLPDCGHFSPDEQPLALAACLREFVGGDSTGLS